MLPDAQFPFYRGRHDLQEGWAFCHHVRVWRGAFEWVSEDDLERESASPCGFILGENKHNLANHPHLPISHQAGMDGP